jgi:hypothetical protein
MYLLSLLRIYPLLDKCGRYDRERRGVGYFGDLVTCVCVSEAHESEFRHYPPRDGNFTTTY